MPGGVEARITELGYELPIVPRPAGSYVSALRVGTLLFTAGQLPFREGQLCHTGKVGQDLSIEDAQEAARLCALNALAAVKVESNSLDNVRHVAKVTGYVASAASFNNSPR